jgi:uncharacterized protein (DUF4415 family)
MNKKSSPELLDEENPEWTDEMFRQSVRFDALPESLKTKLKPPPRGPQKTPVKVQTTIRLSPDVMDAFKATGKGWQTRIDVALSEWLKTRRVA